MAKRLLVFLLATAPVLAWADSGSWHVPDFTAVYSARVGIAKGETRLSLRREDERTFVVESHTRLKGLVSLFKRGEIAEFSRFEYVDGELLAIEFVRRDEVSSENRDVRVVYDWARDVATVEHAGQTREIDIEPGVTNTLLMQVALMQAISNGERRPWFDAVGHKGRLRFEVRYEGDAVASERGRDVAALRYSHSRTDSGIRTTFWAAPDMAHLPVRAEIVKEGRLKGRLELAGYAPNAAASTSRSAAAD